MAVVDGEERRGAAMSRDERRRAATRDSERRRPEVRVVNDGDQMSPVREAKIADILVERKRFERERHGYFGHKCLVQVSSMG